MEITIFGNNKYTFLGLIFVDKSFSYFKGFTIEKYVVLYYHMYKIKGISMKRSGLQVQPDNFWPGICHILMNGVIM